MPSIVVIPRRRGALGRAPTVLLCLGAPSPGARGTVGFLAVLLAISAAVPTTAALHLRNVLDEYSLTSWGPTDGLPASEVLAIAQDRDGFLWLGTNGGLVRFDGTRFILQPGPAVDRSVRALVITRDGELWAGLGENGGALRYRIDGGGRLTLLDEHGPASGLAVGATRALVEDVDGAVWLGHLGGLFRHDAGTWTRWPLPVGTAEVHSLAVEPRGRLLVGTRHGVFATAAGGDRQRFEPLGEAGRQDEAVAGLSVDARGGIWRTDRVHGFQGMLGERRRVSPAEIARGQRLIHDRAGHLWVGTGGQGLWRVSLDGDDRLLVEQSMAATGLLGNGVVSVFEDRDGNIWAGTLDGLNRLSRHVARPIQGLGLVSGVEASAQGIWVMTAESLLLFVGGATDRPPTIAYRGEVTALHADERGRLWMASGDRLAWFDEEGHHDASALARGLANVALITSDRRGGLWLYDSGLGLQHRPAAGQPPVPRPPRLDGERLTWMDTAPDGTVWLATTAGALIRLDTAGTTAEFGPTDGLAAGVVRAWHLGGDGAIWLGGVNGVARLHQGRFATVHETQGHRLEQISALVEDRRGHVWTGTRQGLARVALTDLHRRLETPGETMPVAFLTKADGLAGSPRWYGHRGAVVDDSGRLWVVTSRGLSLVDPDALTPPRPVEARIDTILVDGEPASTPATLAAGTKGVAVHFGGLALTATPTTRFRYRLEGFDHDWVDAGVRREATYTNLAPGRYTFQVMATSTDGTWPARGAAWDFAVAPMFYQTTWFLAACVLGVVGAITAAWRLHLRRVRAEMSILLAERARVAREIHDTLLQGLFGVALRCDAIAAEVGDSAPQVRSHFLTMRRDVAQYVREARQSILGLRSPTLQDLGLASALRATGEQLSAAAPVRFAFAERGEPRACPPAAEEQILRIGQEAIANAVRHARATAVSVELRYDTDGVVLSVADDGRGIDVDIAPGAGGLGLASMRERALAAGGLMHIVSVRGEGTRVEVRVPYAHGHVAA
jgi:signal transduction histidine kinase/ligand-binding sensor domain-containing protein